MLMNRTILEPNHMINKSNRAKTKNEKLQISEQYIKSIVLILKLKRFGSSNF